MAATLSAASLSRVVKSLSYSAKPRGISTLLLSKKGVTDACVTELRLAERRGEARNRPSSR